jgi:hyperosmotically inducible periplasmic protein
MIMLTRKSVVTPLLAATLLAACGSTPTRESTGQYIDDSSITAKIKAAFVADEQVKARDVSVETFKGTVQLSGFADTRAEMQRAVDLAAKVPGVKQVENDIQLKPSNH